MQVKDFDLISITSNATSKPRGLAKREMEVFTLSGQGFDCREITDKMGISRRKVESHRDHIKAKLGVKSIIQLYQLAYRYVNEV